jgi:hypothetical protein
LKNQITFPMVVRGIPPKSRSTKAIRASHIHTHEIPEFSKRESDVVLTAHHAFESDGKRRVPRHYELRRIGDRHFRRIGQVAELESLCAPDRTFGDTERGSSISFVSSRMDRPPVSEAIDGHTSMLRRDAVFRKTGYWSFENGEAADFDTSKSKLRSYDAEDVDRNLKMFARQAEKLVILDDEVWFESGNPAYVITIRDNRGSDMNASQALVPSSYDARVSRRRFPLSRYDDYLAFVERNLHRVEAFNDANVALDVPDRSVFDFDHVEAEEWKMGMAVAFYCAEAAESTIDLRLTDEDRDTIAAAREEAVATNMVLGIRGEPQKYLEALEPIRARIAATRFRPLDPMMHASDFLVADILEQRANRPIDIHGLGFGD